VSDRLDSARAVWSPARSYDQGNPPQKMKYSVSDDFTHRIVSLIYHDSVGKVCGAYSDKNCLRLFHRLDCALHTLYSVSAQRFAKKIFLFESLQNQETSTERAYKSFGMTKTAVSIYTRESYAAKGRPGNC
jgi:hypothetical protein